MNADVSLLQPGHSDLGSEYPVPPPPLDVEFNYPKDTQKITEVADNSFSPSEDTFRSIQTQPTQNQAQDHADSYESPSQVAFSQVEYQAPSYDYRAVPPQYVTYDVVPGNLQLYQHKTYTYTYDDVPSQEYNYYQPSSQQYTANVADQSYTYPGTKKDSTGYHYAVPKNPLFI